MHTDDNLSQHGQDFLAYPTHRMTCYFASEADFHAAMKTFAAAGFDVNDIYVLHGSEGIDVLDIDGTRHGVLARLSRLVQSVLADSEIREFEQMKAHLEQGHIVIGVHAHGDAERERVRQIMHDHRGHHIVYFANFYIETVEQ